MDLAAGTVFAGHRIQGVAGRGGMGVVYRATQLDLERTVALKLIAPELAEDPDFRARFVRESRLAASIDHPNVIPVYSAGEHDGQLYIAMRFVEGEDMRALLRREGALEPGRAAAIVGQTASALDAAHARGLVHRDVKPANVLLTAGDHAYLTDFGLTKSVSSATGLSHAGQWVGTLGYVAPEQIRGGHVDARADVYALGCLLFFALTGSTPFRRDSDEATMWAHLHDPPPSPSQLAAGVPASFDDVIVRALAKDPADRFPSCGDLGRTALVAAGRIVAETPPERQVATGAAAASGADAPTTTSPVEEPAADAPTTVVPEHRRRRGRLAVAIGLALVAIAGVAVAAVLATGGDGEDQGPTEAGRLLADVPVGTRPNDVVVADGFAWTVSNIDGKITRVDTRPPYAASHDKLDVGSGATALTAGFGSLWVVKQSTRRMLRYSLETHRRVGAPTNVEGVPFAVATGATGVWVGSRSGRNSPVQQSVSRVSPKSGQVANYYELADGMQDIAVGAGAVWIANRHTPTITRLDVETGQQRRYPVGGKPWAIAVGAGAVWVTTDRNVVVRAEIGNPRRTSTIAVGSDPKGVAATDDAVWVSNESDSTVVRIDPRTRHKVGEPVDVGLNPKALAIDGRTLWVADVSSDSLSVVGF